MILQVTESCHSCLQERTTHPEINDQKHLHLTTLPPCPSCGRRRDLIISPQKRGA